MYPSFMDEDMVDAADTLDSSFFSKASAVPRWLPERGGVPVPLHGGWTWSGALVGTPVLVLHPAREQGHWWPLQSPGLGDVLGVAGSDAGIVGMFHTLCCAVSGVSVGIPPSPGSGARWSQAVLVMGMLEQREVSHPSHTSKNTSLSSFQMDMHDETYSMPDDVFESPPLSATYLRMHPVGEDARVSPEVEQPTP